VFEQWRGVVQSFSSAVDYSEQKEEGIPSATILTTSSLFTAFSMNRALNLSCSGVLPEVLRSVDSRELI
jgi:hypothetical protein